MASSSCQSTEQIIVETLEDDISTLHPLSPSVISRQATINVGTIGHVAHGKSSLVKTLSGVQTVRFKAELKQNITIRLGYANAKVYKCPKCPRPKCYQSFGSGTPDTPNCGTPKCDSKMELLRHFSFVDCPGHDILMATMLNGASIMDAALLIIAGNQSCPQPQTSEHLAAIDIMKLKDIIILQNKTDLVYPDMAASTENYSQILRFTRGTIAEGAPIIPISAMLKYNVDVLLEYMVKKIPIPIRDFTSKPQMMVVRSFDINKPGCSVDDLRGGVAGGSIIKGVLRVGDEIEVRPGIVTKDSAGIITCYPIISRITSLLAESNDLQFAVPGGLIGVGTKIDPTLCMADRLVGHMIGHVGELPYIYTHLEVNFILLSRLLGAKEQSGKVSPTITTLKKDELLMVNVGATSTGGRVIAVKGDLVKLSVTTPVCTNLGQKITISRRIDSHWRLIGWGTIRRGKVSKLKSASSYVNPSTSHNTKEDFDRASSSYIASSSSSAQC